MEFIVGTALAGIPVVLEAYDRYWKLSEALKTFRHYLTELTTLDTIMMTQKTLFRANVTKLLTAITNDQEKARNLLSDSNSAKLEEVKLSTAYDGIRVESLQEMFESWKNMLELVRCTAAAICLEVESFGTSDKPKRFRLCWKKNEVQKSIQKLRDYMADFSELTAGIVNELEQIQSSSRPAQQIMMRPRASQLNCLEKYRQIRSASYRLYHVFALTWSCARNQRHAASISLVDRRKSNKLEKAENSVKFDVAVDCEANSPTCRETPIWLEIEAIDGGHPVTPMDKTEHLETESDNDWTGVMDRLTKNSQPMVIRHVEEVHKRLDRKSVPAQSSNVGTLGVVSCSSTMSADGDQDEETLPTSTSATTDNSTTSDFMVDLKMIENFCGHLQVLQPICSNTCVGYIQDLSLHRFYLPPPERRPSKQQKSLADIITWISEDELSHDLPITTVAHIASSLAAAVLQFHSTPWLPDSWQSSQVRYFGIGELSEDADGISSTTPYFRADFSKPDEGKGLLLTTVATSQPSPGASTTSTCSTSSGNAPVPVSMALARNEVLFRFGIVLLELGYSQLWPRLRRRVFADLPPEKNTDYHAAEKLAQTPFLRNRMGHKFTTIVRKCLGCDFGLGENDLANEQLQGVFLVDVVRELQAIEGGLKGLGLH